LVSIGSALGRPPLATQFGRRMRLALKQIMNMLAVRVAFRKRGLPRSMSRGGCLASWGVSGGASDRLVQNISLAGTKMQRNCQNSHASQPHNRLPILPR
jgi:hypothetical protein